MKKIELFLLYISFFMICCTGSSNITVKCSLTKYSQTNLYCGVVSVWVAMKFENIGSKKSLIGLIHCPELYDSTFFKEGNVYELKGTKKLPDERMDFVINSFKKENLPIYAVSDIKLIK